MKAGESFQLNAAWWKKGKPLTLKTTGLGAALTTYQTSRTQFNAQKTNDAKFEACLSALEAVNTARLHAITLCANDHKDTKAALQHANLIATETAQIMAAKKQTLVAPMRQLKTRVADLQKHGSSLKSQVDKFVAEKKTYTDTVRQEKETQINLNLTQYLPNAINGGSSAIASLAQQQQMLQKHFPDIWHDFETQRTAFNKNRTTVEALKIQAEKAMG